MRKRGTSGAGGNTENPARSLKKAMAYPRHSPSATMRPYRFKIRLSSKRLNVTRLGKGPAAELRTAAPYSLGSASSDVELMERLLLSSQRHDRADCLPPQWAADSPAEINARR